MKFRRETKYGLMGLIYLAQQPRGRVVGLPEVAASQGLPLGFLAKIFPKLVQHGLVRAYRGASRGYALLRAPEEITLLEIVEATEGPHVTTQCFFWGSECDVTNPCPMHCQWREIRSWITQTLESTTLRDVILKELMMQQLCAEDASPRRAPAGRAAADVGTPGNG